MEDLTERDLDAAHESLYHAARRYCAITEHGFVQGASRHRLRAPGVRENRRRRERPRRSRAAVHRGLRPVDSLPATRRAR
jgi:hypothetical protein